MEQATNKFFDAIARGIYSMGLVTSVMLFVIVSMIFFSHTLFLQVFPGTMAEWERQIGTWLMALGWESTVLVTMCNPKYIGKRVPVFMAIASGFIVLFFIEAFDFSQPLLVIIQRWFIGSLAGTINFVFAKIFHRKWMEKNELAALPMQLQERDQEVNELRSILNVTSTKLNESQSVIIELRSVVKERDRDVKELQSKLNELQEDLKCEWCGLVERSKGSLTAHKGHCKKNPKKLIEA